MWCLVSSVNEYIKMDYHALLIKDMQYRSAIGVINSAESEVWNWQHAKYHGILNSEHYYSQVRRETRHAGIIKHRRDSGVHSKGRSQNPSAHLTGVTFYTDTQILIIHYNVYTILHYNIIYHTPLKYTILYSNIIKYAPL